MDTAVTWGDVATFAGWGLLGLGMLVVGAIIVVVLLAVAGAFNDWSH